MSKSNKTKSIELASSIKTITDVFVYANKIIKTVQKSIDTDPICCIEINKTNDKTVELEPKNVISGSKAVTTFLELLRQEQKQALIDKVKGCGPFLKLADHFKSNDTDIFFLNSKEVSRVKYENVDIIHLKTVDIKEHLSNFDLTCCRCSMNFESTKFWVSLQCLYTMLTGNCFLPKYLESLEKFKTVYVSANGEYTSYVNNHKNTKCSKMFARTQLRIEKYTERGYKFEYVETDRVMPFINSNHMSSYTGGY